MTNSPAAPKTKRRVSRGLGQSTALACSLVLAGCQRAPQKDPEPCRDPCGSSQAEADKPSPAAPPPLAPGSVAPPNGAPLTFADLAERANPSVVFVRTLVTQTLGYRRVMNEGSGSGFVFDGSGLILTNYHVVKQASAIRVDLLDGREFPAQVIGADPLTDLAVLRVSAGTLPALTLGDSSKVRVGDWVVAIGNPFGLSHTVSAGIISARERTKEDVGLGDPRAYYSFLQTDASINPGNSGGPLLDLQGRVIGINTAINPEANSIGFAIPSDMVRELLPRLLKDGVIVRAAIGVHVADEKGGARILQVIPGGPSHAAGMKPGDVVVQVGEHPIADATALRWRVSLSKVGEPLPVRVRRGGELVELQIVPVQLPMP